MKEIYSGIAERWNQEKGLIVRIPEKGFITIPKTEISLYPFDKVDKFGIPLEVKSLLRRNIVFLKKENGVFSRKAIMMEDFNNLYVGKIVEAKISSIANIGIFLRYKTLIMFCPISEISNSFVKTPDECFYKGQSINVKVLSKPDENRYVIVSYKATFNPDMFRFSIGDTLVCKVTNVNESIEAYFLEVTPAINGILNINDCPITLKYGDRIIGIVRKITSKGIKISFQQKI